MQELKDFTWHESTVEVPRAGFLAAMPVGASVVVDVDLSHGEGDFVVRYQTQGKNGKVIRKLDGVCLVEIDIGENMRICAPIAMTDLIW